MALAGIDVGSVNTSIVILDDGHILSYSIVSSAEEGSEPHQALELAMEEASIGWKKIAAVVATGRGRSGVDFAQSNPSPPMTSVLPALGYFSSLWPT